MSTRIWAIPAMACRNLSCTATQRAHCSPEWHQVCVCVVCVLLQTYTYDIKPIRDRSRPETGLLILGDTSLAGGSTVPTTGGAGGGGTPSAADGRMLMVGESVMDMASSGSGAGGGSVHSYEVGAVRSTHVASCTSRSAAGCKLHSSWVASTMCAFFPPGVLHPHATHSVHTLWLLCLFSSCVSS